MRQETDVPYSIARMALAFVTAGIAGLGLVAFICIIGMSAAECHRRIPPPFIPETVPAPIRVEPPAAPTFYEGTPPPAIRLPLVCEGSPVLGAMPTEFLFHRPASKGLAQVQGTGMSFGASRRGRVAPCGTGRFDCRCTARWCAAGRDGHRYKAQPPPPRGTPRAWEGPRRPLSQSDVAGAGPAGSPRRGC